VNNEHLRKTLVTQIL